VSERALTLGLVGPLPPPNGGMAMQTQQLAQLLSLESISVQQLATNSPYRPSWVGQIKGLRAVLRLIPYLWGVWSLTGRVEVIHMMANSGWSWQLFSAPVIWIGWLRRTPVIVNYRGGEAPTYFQKSFGWIKPSMDKAFSIIVPSGFLQQVFSDFGTTTAVIPNIINLDRFKPLIGGERRKGFTLILTRNLEPIYGIDTAIKAVAELRASIPGLRLLIAGSGPQLRALQSLVQELNLQEQVVFVGRLDPDEIVVFYQSADAMLNPTTVDNMPNSVLEAMACGVPVISTDVGGVPYIVKNESTALLVPVGDEKKMAAAIRRLYGDEALQKKLIQNGISEVKQYAWPQVKGKWMALYAAAVRREAA